MQIRIAEYSDRDAWDAYVLMHPDGLAYQLFAWKSAVEEAYGFKGLYLIAEKNCEICGILPLIQFKGLSCNSSLISLPYCDAAGLLADDIAVSEQLLLYAAKLAKQKNMKYQIRSSRVQSDDFLGKTSKVRMVLPLCSSSEELMKQFKSKLRSQIRKPERDGLTVSLGGRELVNSFYQVFSQNMRDLGSPVHSKKLIDSILCHYGNRALVGVVYSPNGEPAAAGIILMAGQIVSIPWASSLRSFNRFNPNMLLYWNFLSYSADHQFSFFDFGRSTIGEGTYKFKQQWGAEPQPLSWLEYSSEGKVIPIPYSSQESAIRRAVVSIWSKLPTGVATICGPYLRKHLSL